MGKFQNEDTTEGKVLRESFRMRILLREMLNGKFQIEDTLEGNLARESFRMRMLLSEMLEGKVTECRCY